MFRKSKKLFRNSRAGMTLVEIMVVITIIITLMSVMAVVVLGRLDDANADMTRIRIGQLEQSLQMYAVKHKGKYPSTSQGLSAADRYMPTPGEVPTDAWGNEFQYFSPGTHGSADYEIVSLGKDGKEGGEDAGSDIQSWNLDGDEEE